VVVVVVVVVLDIAHLVHLVLHPIALKFFSQFGGQLV
jgi:hypothetical protein